MKLKDVFFRKMTLLYVFLIGILSFELYIVGNFTITARANLDQETRSSLIVVSFSEEKKEIKGAEIIKGNILAASKLMDVDTSLTGDECIISSDWLRLYKVGSEIEIASNYGDVFCEVKREKALQSGTLTMGDSLNSEDAYFPVPFGKPHFVMFRGMDGGNAKENIEQIEGYISGSKKRISGQGTYVEM